jgi:hypothetical protein
VVVVVVVVRCVATPGGGGGGGGSSCASATPPAISANGASAIILRTICMVDSFRGPGTACARDFQSLVNRRVRAKSRSSPIAQRDGRVLFAKLAFFKHAVRS